MPKPKSPSKTAAHSQVSPKAAAPAAPKTNVRAARSARPATTGAAPKRRTKSAPQPSLGHDAIAQRAYELFVLDGARHGHDVEHWLRAEQELRERPELRQAS